MGTLSLRGYNQEIESLIKQNRFDEAIGHCRHILSKFPKHIDTYRLLGKAYLENGQNSNAADIFQRVLSSVPDDFIAHVGMSVIREEEGNLPASVLHMEKAFESQPYNSEIQLELKRLYGRRDGLEPPKVRLTQGALARIYLKGNMVLQGVSELRSVIKENPNRYDLKALLMESYLASNQLANAIGNEFAFSDELHHRDEHSIELSAVWLHHIIKEHSIPDKPMVPILVGSFQHFLVNGDHPQDDRRLNSFLKAERLVGNS